MLPKIVGLIDRRVLLNYRAPPQLINDILPDPFAARIVDDHALIGVCLIRFKHLRPAFSPKFLGITSENAAHRISVRWQDGDCTKTGVYVTRRDTDSSFVHLTGGRVFPGVHSKVSFDCEENETSARISIRDKSQELVRLDGEVRGEFSSGVFQSHAEASDYFRLDRIGYSPARQANLLEGLELNCHHWQTESLSISESYVREFASLSSEVEFDHALMMRNISHDWSEVPRVCCCLEKSSRVFDTHGSRSPEL